MRQCYRRSAPALLRSLTLIAPPCPVTFDLARRVKLIQVYVKVKMNKKIYLVLLARRTTAVVTLRLLYLKKP